MLSTSLINVVAGDPEVCPRVVLGVRAKTLDRERGLILAGEAAVLSRKPARRSPNPTLLELAGLPVPEHAAGISLGPYLRSGRALPERTIYCDNGGELSAYTNAGFTRVRGLKQAWDPSRSLTDPPPSAKWKSFQWNSDGSWKRVAGARADKEIESYYRDAMPMAEAVEPNAEDIEPGSARQAGLLPKVDT